MIPFHPVRWNLQALDLTLSQVTELAELSLEDRATISYQESVQLWVAAEQLLDDPSVGHRAGAQVRITELGAIGGVLAHAADVREALANIHRVVPLVLPGTFTVEPADAGVCIGYERPASTISSRHGIESLFGSIVSTLRHATRHDLRAQQVVFANPPPPEPTTYDRFYGVTVEWNGRRSCLWLDDGVLTLPMAAADPRLSVLLMAHAEQLVSIDASRSATEQRVSRAFLAALHLGNPTLKATARELGLSERTLQRQLDAAGVSFRALRAERLRERAEQLLADPSRSIEQVAELLGYDTRAGFDRAFRIWTGTTPAGFRRARTQR